MGSYAQCWLSGLYVGSSKNDVDPSLICHFREVDKRVVSDLKLLPPELKHWTEGERDDDFAAVYYETPTSVIKDRLEVFGYTVDNCRAAFTRAIELRLTETLHRAEEHANDSLGDLYRLHADCLRQMTVDRWLELLVECASRGFTPSPFSRDFHEGPHKGTLLGYMLSEEECWYGCPAFDSNVPLRLAIERFPAGSMIYDITDLVLSEYIDPEETFRERGPRTAEEEYTRRERTLVLTEGHSDAAILRAALDLLYPHLAEYFSFMDFETSRAEGGAPRLAGLMKSFAGAGVVNRTIALFDNDAAGAVALSSLAGLPLPSHMVLRKLPDLPFLTSYPTIGPTGVVNADVNGAAASIELMLGADVLTDPAQGLHAVRWTGLENSLGRYQGEVSNKALIRQRFETKIARARASPQALEQGDWVGLRATLQVLFDAFHQPQRAAMLSFVDEIFKM